MKKAKTVVGIISSLLFYATAIVLVFLGMRPSFSMTICFNYACMCFAFGMIVALGFDIIEGIEQSRQKNLV